MTQEQKCSVSGISVLTENKLVLTCFLN